MSHPSPPLRPSHETMLQQTPSKPFRFMDLPPEIRNRIYKEILCTFPEPADEDVLEGNIVKVPTGVAMIDHEIETAILRTNRQIYNEAKDIMLKTNQFIRIEVHGLQFSELLISKRIPVVSMDRAAVSKFNGYFLTHLIRDHIGYVFNENTDEYHVIGCTNPEGHFNPYFDLMILGRHLEILCEALSCADITMRGFTRNKEHHITIHDPFKNTSNPNYIDTKKQESLLAPYRKHLQGFQYIDIEGNVSPALANAAVHDLKALDVPEPQAVIDELTRMKDEGSQYYRAKEYQKASRAWHLAVMKIAQIRAGPTWADLSYQGGTEFLEDWVRLHFLLHLNSVQVALHHLKENASNPSLARQLSAIVLESADAAEAELDEQQGTDWWPEAPQMTKLYYRVAVAVRLGNRTDLIDKARRSLTAASMIAPGNRDITGETEEFNRWVGRVQGRNGNRGGRRDFFVNNAQQEEEAWAHFEAGGYGSMTGSSFN